MNGLTRDQIFAINDLPVKEVTVPDHIPGWAGQIVCIKPLTRAQQDAYQQRQFGNMKMKQTPGKQMAQELVSINLYGHDTWVFICGVCDEKGAPLFTERDSSTLASKSGPAIGWIAQQILEYSQMSEQITSETLESDVKNS